MLESFANDSLVLLIKSGNSNKDRLQAIMGAVVNNEKLVGLPRVFNPDSMPEPVQTACKFVMEAADVILGILNPAKLVSLDAFNALLNRKGKSPLRSTLKIPLETGYRQEIDDILRTATKSQLLIPELEKHTDALLKTGQKQDMDWDFQLLSNISKKLPEYQSQLRPGAAVSLEKALLRHLLLVSRNMITYDMSLQQPIPCRQPDIDLVMAGLKLFEKDRSAADQLVEMSTWKTSARKQLARNHLQDLCGQLKNNSEVNIVDLRGALAGAECNFNKDMTDGERPPLQADMMQALPTLLKWLKDHVSWQLLLGPRLHSHIHLQRERYIYIYI